MSTVAVTLSIVSINFNDATGLERTAKSINSLNFKDFEWIVIDGGSKDASVEIAKKYSADKLISEKDKGIYDAMNKGISLASGRLIIFMNSGDSFFSAGCLDFLTGIDQGLCLIHADALCCKDNRSFKRISKIKGPLSFLSLTSYCHQSIIYNLEAIKNIGGYTLDLTISSDYDLTYRYTKRFGAIKQYSIIARHELDGVSNLGRFDAIKENLKSLRKNGPFYVFFLLLIIMPLMVLKMFVIAGMEKMGLLWGYRRARGYLRGDSKTDNNTLN